ncbi:hypothetical protein BDR06DRAFT_968781 [Suillus hirtellus]|nr:hypothetical protein BDR06DRAFT_968781 [Suillus hirtellus]
MWSRIKPVTMRFSSAIVLTVITALTSSVSAMPAQNALDNSCIIDLTAHTKIETRPSVKSSETCQQESASSTPQATPTIRPPKRHRQARVLAEDIFGRGHTGKGGVVGTPFVLRACCLGVRREKGGIAALSSDELEGEEEWELLKKESRDDRGASESVLAWRSYISFWELQVRSGGHLGLMRRKVGGGSIISREARVREFETGGGSFKHWIHTKLPEDTLLAS